MFLLNLVPEASPTQIELLERRLSEAFPQGSFTLARQPDTQSLVVLTRWGSAAGRGNYALSGDLLVQDGRGAELNRALDQYIATTLQGRRLA